MAFDRGYANSLFSQAVVPWPLHFFFVLLVDVDDVAVASCVNKISGFIRQSSLTSPHVVEFSKATHFRT